MEKICPFSHIEEIMKRVPDYYFRSKNVDHPDYEWFTSAPKFSTFRCNRGLNYSSNDVKQLITNALQQKYERHGELPSVDQHAELSDCVVIGCYNYDFEKTAFKCEGEVIIDGPCASAVLRGADIFAAGILGLCSDIREGDWVNIFADLDKKCLRGFNKTFSGRKYLIGVGILKMNRKTLFGKNQSCPKGVGVEVIWTRSGVPQINLPREVGLLQNLPSMICGHLFCDVSGQVLDMCAAPGNKTTHIATIIGNKGHVVALDKTPQKVQRIISLSIQLGLTNIRCFVHDSTKCIQNVVADQDTLNISQPPFPPSSFSAILLDPPCSALGLRPILYNKISASELDSYVILQRRFFKNAVDGLISGGMLVYSTCTITVEENEEMVSWALRKFPNLYLQSITPSLGRPGVPSSLSKENQMMVSRFGGPNPTTPDEDTIGFFIAKFIKMA